MAASPIWFENEHRWKIRVKRDGRERVFSSSKPGKAGKSEVLRKYRLYLDGAAPERASISVASAYAEYLNHVRNKNGIKSTPYHHAETLGRLYILPKIGRKKLCKTTLNDWQMCINTACRQEDPSQPLSKKYLSNLRAIISSFIKWCYWNNLTEPLRGQLYIPAGHPTLGKDILQPSDIKTLFAESDDWYHPAWCFMVVTGLRPGECYGLQIGDIQDDDTIVINRSVNDKRQITGGKNANAKRIVPLHPIAKKIIEETIVRNDKYRLFTDWIFCARDGSPASPDTARKHWRKFARERGLKGSPYSFRHTFISMIKNAMPEQMIKEIVGHSISMDTFGVYGHLVDGEIKQAADILDLTFKRASTGSGEQ